MTVLAALTGPIPKLGVVMVALTAAVALLAPSSRARALGALAALGLAPVLLLTEIWNSPQLHVIHSHPVLALVGGGLGLAVLAAAARLIAVRPGLLAPLVVLALPFRVPIQAGGATSNLLVPLYLVVAAGTLAWAAPALRRGPQGKAATAAVEGRWGVWVERLLALFIVFYAFQALYSPSFEKALQNMVFFYVPFALLYRLIRSLNWTPRMIRDCLLVLVALALLFSVIAYAEYATKTIILNPKLVVTNDLHTYFTVNSVFFDPDIFGRFLALAMTTVAVLLIYPRAVREHVAATVILAALWVALVLTLSRSSLGALLIGLAALAALRWKPSRALVIATAVIALGGLAVAASPSTFGLNQGVNGASSGRGGLISGGISLFADRPVWGWGSGSFVTEYRAHHHAVATALSASHTIPITIGAEQGLIGELAYLPLVIVAVICLVRGARGDPVRSAVAAAFIALVFHTMLYADFLEDPITWALLSAGVGLSAIASTGAPKPTAGVRRPAEASLAPS